MPVRPRPNRPGWQADVLLPTGRKRKQFRSKRHAEEYERKQLNLRDELRAGASGQTHQDATEIPTLRAFKETYLEDAKVNKAKASADRDDVTLRRHLLPALGDLRLDLISFDDVESYKRRRRFEKAGPATINRELNTLSHLLTIAQDRGLRRDRPRVRLLPVTQERTITWLSKAEDREKLLEAATTLSVELAGIVGALMFQGLRKGEVWRLKWADVDRARGTLTIESSEQHGRTKGKRTRILPLHPRFAKLLIQVRKLKHRKNGTRRPRGPYIFPGEGGDQRDPKSKLRGFRDALTNAGLSGVTLHTLRHTYCSRLRELGAELSEIALLAGHRDLRTSARYVHQDPRRFKELQEKV